MNKAHYEILQKGVKEWNKWRKANQNIKPQLNGANLRGANLFRANLKEANLKEADLFRSNLGEANLHKADLFKANLGGVNLGSANLTGNVLAVWINGQLVSQQLMKGRFVTRLEDITR